MTGPQDDAGETFDRIARPFDATRSRPWPFVAEWLRRLEAGSGPVVDVGCGNGRHLSLLTGTGLTGVGVDLSCELLGLARGRVGPDTGLVLGDARRLPIHDASAGAVLAVAVLHHVPTEMGRKDAVAELARIARPGAEVLVSTWALDDIEVARRARARPKPGGDGRDLLVPWRAPDGPEVDRYYRAMTRSELNALIEGAGLEVEESRQEGANHVSEARRP